MEKVKLDNKRILFNLLPAHVAQHFLMSNPRNMVSINRHVQACPTSIISLKGGKTSQTSKHFPVFPDAPGRSWFSDLQVKRHPDIWLKGVL